MFDDAADSFLTLLAAKERRVLELRSELAKAEADLQHLQHQYSTHEDRSRRVAPPASQYASKVSASTAASNVNAHVRARSSADWHSVTSASSSNSSTSTAATATVASDTKQFGGAGRMLGSSFPFPSPPKTAPSGRPLAPPRTSSLADQSPTGRGIGDSLSSSPAPIEDLPYLMHNDEFEFDGESGHNPNVPIRADEVIYMGKKLAEGINSHFWNFYKDLKSAAIGEEILSGSGHSGGSSKRGLGSPQPSAVEGQVTNRTVVSERGASRAATASNTFDWRHSRSSTFDSRDSANDYVDEDDEEDDTLQQSPSPPIRHISSFTTSPDEPLGVDSAEFRGSPPSKNHPLGEYSGYSVLRETPAGVSTSLIDLESSEDETQTSFTATALPTTTDTTVHSHLSSTSSSKRYSVYNPDFDLAAAAGKRSGSSSRNSSKSREASFF